MQINGSRKGAKIAKGIAFSLRSLRLCVRSFCAEQFAKVAEQFGLCGQTWLQGTACFCVLLVGYISSADDFRPKGPAVHLARAEGPGIVAQQEMRPEGPTVQLAADAHKSDEQPALQAFGQSLLGTNPARGAGLDELLALWAGRLFQTPAVKSTSCEFESVSDSSHGHPADGVTVAPPLDFQVSPLSKMIGFHSAEIEDDFLRETLPTETELDEPRLALEVGSSSRLGGSLALPGDLRRLPPSVLLTAEEIDALPDPEESDGEHQHYFPMRHFPTRPDWSGPYVFGGVTVTR